MFLFSFIAKPFLPDQKVSHVLVAADLSEELKKAIEDLGVTAVSSPYSKSLPRHIRFHPDMNCRHLGGKRFAVFKDSENLSPILSLGAELVFVDPPEKPVYPYDAALNYLPLGNKIICNPEAADKSSMKMLPCADKISVKQGYSACSVAVLSEDTIITGDKGIRREAEKYGIKVLNADHSGIILEGYNNGFIGGASGLTAPDTICFTGDTSGVINSDEIKAMGYKIVILGNSPMTDVGGIVPIMQVSKV